MSNIFVSPGVNLKISLYNVSLVILIPNLHHSIKAIEFIIVYDSISLKLFISLEKSNPPCLNE